QVAFRRIIGYHRDMTQGIEPSEIARFTSNYLNEREAEAMYEALAQAEKHQPQADVLRKLAAVEGRHAARWEERLRAAGVEPPPLRLGPRVRMITWLGRHVGVDAVLPLVRGMELRSAGEYEHQADAQDFIRDERSNARTLTALTEGRAGGTPAAVAEATSESI